jgi:hypothetical protein
VGRRCGGYRAIGITATHPVVKRTWRDVVRGRHAWLRRELAAGPARSDRLAAAAKAVGIPRHQLQRARLQLGIQADRHGQHWIWRTP